MGRPRDLTRVCDGIRSMFIAMGSIGIESVLQRIVINAAAGISSIEQVTCLSVFNTSAGSRGINQRAHYSIDQFASSTGVPYLTIRPAIFSLSVSNTAMTGGCRGQIVMRSSPLAFVPMGTDGAIRPQRGRV